jgi:heme A synthase
MCYESLVEGEGTERPLAALLRAELRDALKTGLATGMIVVAVLATSGLDSVLTAVAAVGALALGAAVHQALLVVAAVVLRVWSVLGSGGRHGESGGHEV